MSGNVETTLLRTKAELNDLLRHGHIIPISRGLTDRHVGAHYPGWTWNSLMRLLTAAEVVVLRGGSPPRCVENVVSVRFDATGSWCVTWEGGARTTGIATSFATPDGTSEVAAFEVSTGLRVETQQRPAS